MQLYVSKCYWTDRGKGSITYLLANKDALSFSICRWTKLFDLQKIAVQYYIQDIRR